jgi:hypothetical protein
MSPTVTHNLIVADRSESGLIAVASILEVCPLADEHISAWQNSTDAFFIFIAEHGGRIGSISAANLDHLLGTILPELFAEHLMPSTSSEFDIFVDDPIAGTIHDRIVRLQISVALEAGRQTDNRLANAEAPPHVREHKRPQQNTPLDLTRGERERSIRYLCRVWRETRSTRSMRLQQPEFSDFEAWLKANGYSHYLNVVSDGHPDVDAEAWFTDELSHVGRFGR